MLKKCLLIIYVLIFLFVSLVFAQTPGTLKWVFPTGSTIKSSPAIDSEGVIYVGSDDKNLYAINPDGTLKWAFPTGGWVRSTPAIGSDGSIIVGSDDKNLYAINADGTLKWIFETIAGIYSSPAIGSDGTIYVGSLSVYGYVYAVNPNGSLKWSYATGDSVLSSPAIGNDGTIYVGSWADKVCAINPDGTLKWSFSTGYVECSPTVGPDGTIFVGSSDGKVYAINPDGSLKWFFEGSSPFNQAPAIGSDETIYLAEYYGGYIYGLNSDGSIQWSLNIGSPIISSPVIGSDGTIYIGKGWNLYAIYSSSACLADGVWPMFHKDARHTGLYSLPAIVDMASFVIEKARIDLKKKPGDDKIQVKGRFELGSDSNGVDIVEDVVVIIASGDGLFTEAITMYEKGHKWEYKRLKKEKGKKGIKHMKIDWKHYPEAKFDIHIDHWELNADLWNDPEQVTISIQIGDDKGSEIITMKEHKHHWDYHKKKHH